MSSIRTLITAAITPVHSSPVLPRKKWHSSQKALAATPVISPRSVCLLLYCVLCHKKKRGRRYGRNLFPAYFRHRFKCRKLPPKNDNRRGGVYLAGVYRTCSHGSLRGGGWLVGAGRPPPPLQLHLPPPSPLPWYFYLAAATDPSLIQFLSLITHTYTLTKRHLHTSTPASRTHTQARGATWGVWSKPDRKGETASRCCCCCCNQSDASEDLILPAKVGMCYTENQSICCSAMRRVCCPCEDTALILDAPSHTYIHTHRPLYLCLKM